MQILNGRDDEALDFHLGLAVGQALGINRLILFCVRRSTAFASAVAEWHADPPVWAPRRDEDLSTLATCESDVTTREEEMRQGHTTSHFRVDLEGNSQLKLRAGLVGEWTHNKLPITR